MQKSDPPLVLFNASVILAGIRSPMGGSGKLLLWSVSGKIIGVASEIIVDEAMRNGPKIGVASQSVLEQIDKANITVYPAPKASIVGRFEKLVVDGGDAHVLASAQEQRVNFLVTLDKKHLLILQKDIRQFAIISPGELITTVLP